MAQEPAWLSQSSKVDSDSWLDQVSKPVATSQTKKDLPLGDVTDVLSALGETATSLPTTVAASFGQMYEGTMNPWQKGTDSIERQKAMRDVQRQAELSQAEAEASGDASIAGRAIRSGIPSYGFTGAIMPASIVAGGATGLATAAATRNPVTAQRAAMAAGTAASGYAAYRMASAQFLDDARERIDNFFLEKAGRLPNEKEQEEAYQELLPLAREMGMAEALPEAFGNLALAGAGKYIYRILGGKTGVQQLASGALSKVKGLDALKSVGAGVAGTGAELTTEGITEVLQQSPYTKLEEGVMRGVPVESVQTEPFTLERLGEGIERVAEPTLATTLLMGGLGAVGTAGYRRATRKDFEQNDFRDKLIQQSVTARRAMTDKGVTEADKANLTNKAEEAEAALKALNEGRSSDVEKYFNVRFIQPMVNPAISAAQGLNDAPASNPDASQAASAAQAEIEKAKAETERLAAEQAAEAARIAGEKGKAAASAIPKANVPPPPSPIITPDSTIDELQGELILRQNVRKTLDFGDQGNAQIDNDIQTLTQEIQSRSVTPPVVTTPPAVSEATAPAEPPSLPTRQAAAPAVGTPPTPTTTPEDATIQREIPKDGQQERVETDEGGPSAETGGGYSPVFGRQVKAQKEVDRSVAMPPPPEGVDEDIIDYILGNWSIESVGKKQRGKRRTTGEVEAFERLSQRLPLPARNILFSPDRGRNINRGNLDIIAQAAFDRKLITSPDANTLTDAILDAYNARKSGESPFTEVSQREQADEQRRVEFEKAIRDRTAPLTLIPARDLDVGDVVQIGDDNMRVTLESDEDGYPTAAILTGPKFGEQRVDPNKPLKAEKHDTTNRIQDTSEFVPPDELEGVTPVPITPREEPTDATKGTVTPRGAAILPALEQPPVEAATEVSQPSQNLPALVAVRDNAATPEQVQSLADQGLVEQVDGQNIITEAGVAEMPEDQRPKLTPAERRAEVEEMAAPAARLPTEAPAAQPPAAEAAPPVVEPAPVEELAEEPPTPEAETQAQQTIEGEEDVEPDIDAAISSSLTDEEKIVAAEELGQPEWNQEAVKSFKQTLADWSVGVKQVSERLAAIFQKVLDSAKAVMVTLGVFIGSGVNTDTGITPFSSAKENIPVYKVADDLMEIERQRIDQAAEPMKVKLERPSAAISDVLGAMRGETLAIEQPPAIRREGEVALTEGRQAPFAKRANFRNVAASSDATLTADWIVSTNDNKGMSFLVADKVNGAVFIFDGEGNLVRKASALFGMNVGDKMPIEAEAERITPSGRFEAKTDTDVEYYGTTVDFYETDDNVLAIHKVYLEEPAERRQQRLDSKTPADNRISYGCINVDERIFNRDIAPAFADGGIVYVLPETKAGRKKFAPTSLYDQGLADLKRNKAELKKQEKIAKEEAQKNQEIAQSSLKSLFSLISGEKTNATTGNVTLDDANTAMRQIEEARELPNIYFTNATTREEFLADPANESRFPAVWADLKANPNIEGLFDPTTGTAFVFTDKVAVSNLDRKLAEFFGTTPEVAAVRRVLIHESLHKGLGLLSTLDPSAHTAVMRYLNGLFTPEMLDARVADGYTQYSDWRINPDSKAKLIEEVFTEKISTSKELPKDGLWGEFIAVLKQIWRSITGKRGEPTVQDMKDVMRLITNSLRNEGKQRPDRTVGDDSVRFAIPFTRNLLSPEKYARHAELEAKHNAGTITPEETAEAQALVDEAAKAAGYNVGPVYHGSIAGEVPMMFDKRDISFFTTNKETAKVYAGTAGKVGRFYIQTSKLLEAYGPKDILKLLPRELRERHKAATYSWEVLKDKDLPDLYEDSDVIESLSDAGYDGLRIHDDVVTKNGRLERHDTPSLAVFNPSQIKSADPFTSVPLEQRFQPTSPDIRYSIPVTHTSESAAISSSAQNAVTEISYTPRDFDVSLAIRRAFDNLTRRAKQTSVTLEMLYNEALKGLGNMTRDEFGRMVQKAYDNNSALLTKGTADFPVFNRDGDRAGSVVLMARGPMASMIPPDAAPAASDNLRNGVDAAFDTENFAKYTGVPIKGRKAQDHISPDAEKIKEAAIQFVSEMIDARVQDGSSSSEAVMEVADTVANGEFGNKYLMGLPERGRVPVWNFMLGELLVRLRNASSKAAGRGQTSTAKQLEAKHEYVAQYWYSLGTLGGSNQQSRQPVITDPRYAWMFAEKEAKQRMQKNAEEAVAINAGDPGQLGDQVNRNADETDAEAGVAAGKKFDVVLERNQDAIDLAAGEATLNEENKTLWNRVKDWLREIGAAMNHIKSMGGSSRASLTAAQRSDISKMSKEEALAFIEDRQKKVNKALKTLLGEESDPKTPEQKTTREKRKQMVKVVEKIIFREGKDVEFRSVSTQDAVADLFNGADEYGKIVEGVGDALLSRVKQARGAGGAQTPIKQLVESIKRTLLGNLPTPKPAPPTNASLGKMLAMTFAQQIREAGLYADAWSKGRAEVRNLLAKTGLEGEALENELDSIMPPTPALAYAPNAARRTIALAMEQAGVTREQLTDGRINVAEDAKAKVMEAFDQAAAAVSLSEQGWSKQGKTGRQLAEQALNEAVQQWNTQDSNRVKISRIVAEQSESPVSEAEFADKLKSFNLKPAEITKLFDRAKNMAARRVELSEARAQQLIYALGEQFRQGSKDPDKSAGGDSINRAFRDQVSEPMTLDEFIQRLAKLNVGETVATRLFRTAAKERIDRKSMMIFDMLTGPRAASQMLERITRARRGIEMPLRSPISFVQLLGQKARTVNEYRKKVLDQIMASPDFADATEEQKERLADLFASVWQDQYAKIFAAKQARLEQSLLAKGKDRGAEALKAVRNEILESINLGVFNNDLLVRLMGEKFGIKTSFTEAEKARITELGEAAQDDSINKALRNRMGRELVILMAKATNIPIAEILSNWWVSSVLSGLNTVFSIGAAFTNGAYEILGLGPVRAIQKLLDGDMRGAVDNLMASVRGLGRYLKAFPEAFNRAWQYLWSGDVALLESAANDPLARIKTLADINRYESVAEILSKDPNAMKRFIGLYTRFWGRLLAALDAFNVIVTKRGVLSIALRQSDLSIEQIRDMEEKVGLDIYKSNIVKTDPYFKGRMPRAGTYESALLNSMAEAQMYASLTKLGANIENADFTASQAAMTLNPTGAGGFIYNTLMGINAKSTSLANDFVRYAKAKQSGDNKRTILDELELALAYFVQFAAYQAPNILGYRFARFAGNKFNQGVSFLPFIGMLRMYEKNQKQLKGSEAAFVDSIYRNQMIGFVMLAVGQLVIKAIADEPDDEKRGWSWNGGWGNLTPEQIKQKLSAGEKQFTIRIGDRVFNYQNWPVNQMFAAIGSISDMIRFSPKEWTDKDYLDRAISTIVAGTSATMEIPALTQAGEIFGRSFASKDPTEQAMSRVERLAAGWLGGFTPRILKDLDMMADPKMRKYKTIWEKTASHIPIYRRFVGEEYYDILGRQIEKEVYPGSREFMERPSDPAYRILGALNSRNIWLTPANAEYRMVGKGRNRRRLTQEEADAYSLETGKAYKSMILRYGPRALQMSTERARAFLSDKADEVRDRALQKVYRGYRSRTSAQ